MEGNQVVRNDETVARLVDRSRTHWDSGNVEAALACCRQALQLDPSSVDALSNTGTILWINGNVEEAERLYLKAHVIEPTHAGVVLNIAAIHNEAGDLETSLQWINKAQALNPRSPEVVWRKGLIELAMGDYANGWEHYESGLGRESIRGKGPGFRTAQWDGTSCNRLLIWHEQGFGDTIQFVRYAELCRQRASRVYVLCPKELIALVRSCPFVEGAFDAVDEGDFEQQISIMSLPHLFRTTLESVPARVPYLFADRALAASRAAQMRSDKFKVGLVWAGNFRNSQPRYRAIDRSRSLSLREMQPWLDLDDIEFYSLQKGEAGRESAGRKVIDFMHEVDDFAGTAAIIANLDLVISVDTSVVHVAGAMGKPVWVLSRLDACWRWLRNRPDSPWYPSARVFGQTTRGDWRRVIEAVRSELAAL